MIDQSILERHNLLETSIAGVLDIEIDAYQQSWLFSFVFFPTFIGLAMIQYLAFFLYNGRFHPIARILDGTDEDSQGSCREIYNVELKH